MIRRLLHWLAHRTKWNFGTVETWWEGEWLYVGFRCSCGRLSQVHQVGHRPIDKQDHHTIRL